MALVLIVDDESGVRDLLTRWIESAGHETCEADNAEHALEVMTAHPAAVAFCDVQMPGHDGIWLTKQLRGRFSHVAVVLATGVSTLPPAVSMQCGVLAYLVKPFSRAAVLRAFGQALDWHEESVASGPRLEDSTDRLGQWLDSLEA
jgi:DNA-binding NtrC family response regulator